MSDWDKITLKTRIWTIIYRHRNKDISHEELTDLILEQILENKT